MLVGVLTNAQQSSSEAGFIVEATNVTRGIGGYVNRRLWVRLSDEGKLEWEERVQGKPDQIRSVQVGPEQVKSLERILNSTDWNTVHGRMGPYNVYIDSSIEVQISATAANRKHTFSLINPWEPGIRKGALPLDARKILCELDRLHAQASTSSIHQMCADSK